MLALLLRQRCGVDLDRLGGSSPALDPVEAGGDEAPTARYGLHVESEALSSAFVDASSIPANSDGMRSGASRLSWPST